MTAYRFVTLTCDTCGEVFDDGMCVTVADARRQAGKQGWTKVGRSEDRCGVCNGTHYRDGAGYPLRREQ